MPKSDNIIDSKMGLLRNTAVAILVFIIAIQLLYVTGWFHPLIENGTKYGIILITILIILTSLILAVVSRAGDSQEDSEQMERHVSFDVDRRFRGNSSRGEQRDNRFVRQNMRQGANHPSENYFEPKRSSKRPNSNRQLDLTTEENGEDRQFRRFSEWDSYRRPETQPQRPSEREPQKPANIGFNKFPLKPAQTPSSQIERSRPSSSRSNSNASHPRQFKNGHYLITLDQYYQMINRTDSQLSKMYCTSQYSKYLAKQNIRNKGNKSESEKIWEGEIRAKNQAFESDLSQREEEIFDFQ